MAELPEPATNAIRMQPVPEVAMAAAAALDKVLDVPSKSNQHAALAAVHAYLAATEYLWMDIGAGVPG